MAIILEAAFGKEAAQISVPTQSKTNNNKRYHNTATNTLIRIKKMWKM